MNNPAQKQTASAAIPPLDVEHHYADINGIKLHYVTQGEGMPVIFVHGLPHLWYTWHKQIPAVAAAGFKAVAIDLRGMAYSETPASIGEYNGQTAFDLLGLLDELGAEKAVFSGFDVGQVAIWDIAVRAPERVAGIIAFNTPILAPPGQPGDLASVSPDFIAMGKDHFYHFTWYTTDPPANVKLLNANKRDFLRRLIWALSGEYQWVKMLEKPAGTSYLDALPEPPPLPWDWFTEEDLEEYVKAYENSGFQGLVDHYNAFAQPLPPKPENPGRLIDEPVSFICSDRDMDLVDVEIFGKLPLETMRRRCTDLREVLVVREAGHLVHMEKPDEVNAAILRFLESL